MMGGTLKRKSITLKRRVEPKKYGGESHRCDFFSHTPLLVGAGDSENFCDYTVEERGMVFHLVSPCACGRAPLLAPVKSPSVRTSCGSDFWIFTHPRIRGPNKTDNSVLSVLSVFLNIQFLELAFIAP
jgi:hypothetical protein